MVTNSLAIPQKNLSCTVKLLDGSNILIETLAEAQRIASLPLLRQRVMLALHSTPSLQDELRDIAAILHRYGIDAACVEYLEQRLNKLPAKSNDPAFAA